MYSNDTIVLFLFLILIYLIYVNKLTTVIIFEIYTHTLNANLRHDTIHCIEHKGGKYIPLLSLRLKDC